MDKIKLFNTETNSLETFVPREEKKVNLYVCGPTVYASPHIGHARSFVFFDTLAKFLRFQGFEVNYIQNITDMGKSVKKAADNLNIPMDEIIEKFEAEYFDSMEKLNVDSVDIYERSSENVDIVISQIERIIAKGHTYPVNNGVFYDTARQENFGVLSHKNKEELESVEEYSGKKTPQDFSLWKQEPTWGIEMDSPFGKGRPHWHILDSALAEKYFGETFYDIHGAGIDCVYPHHESLRSILQSLSGKTKPVNYWMHNNTVNVNGQKMSKSLENSLTLDEVFQNYDPAVLRLSLLSNHFMDEIEFNQDLLNNSNHKFQNLVSSSNLLEPIFSANLPSGKYGEFTPYANEFMFHLKNNMDTPKALNTLFSFTENINKLKSQNDLTINKVYQASFLLKNMDLILGLGLINRGGVYAK